MKILQLVLIASLFASNLASVWPPPRWNEDITNLIIEKELEKRERQEACEQCLSKCDKVPAVQPPVPVCPPVPICPTMKPVPACPTLKPVPVPVCPTLEPVTDAIILPKEEKGFLEKVLDFILGIGNDQTAEKNKPRSFEPRNIEKLQPVNQGEIEKIEKIEKKK